MGSNVVRTVAALFVSIGASCVATGVSGSSAAGGASSRRDGNNIVYATTPAGIVSIRPGARARASVLVRAQGRGTSSRCLAVVRGGRAMYALTARGVVRIDTVAGRMGRPIPGTRGWTSFAITPGGRVGYLADPLTTNHSASRGEITPVDLTTGRVGRSFRVPGVAIGLAVAPGGRTAYAVTEGGTQLTPVNLVSHTAGKPITVPQGVGSLAITPAGRMAYATGNENVAEPGHVTYSFVTPIDLVTGVAEAPFRYRHAPTDVAISPDGKTLYLTGGIDVGPPKPPAVWEVSAATGRVLGTLRVPGGAAASITVRAR